MRTLELICQAPAWFDPETKKYEVCGGRVEATVEQANGRIPCPTCGAPIPVPSAAYFAANAPPPPGAAEKEPDLPDELRLAPEERRPDATGAKPSWSRPAATPQAKKPQAKASVSDRPAKSQDDDSLSIDESDENDEEVVPLDVEGKGDELSDEEHWAAIEGRAKPPTINSRVRELMDEPDDGEDYRVAGPSEKTPPSATPSRSSSTFDVSSDSASPAAPSSDDPFESLGSSGEGAFDLASGGRVEPADDWLSAPLPGIEPPASQSTLASASASASGPQGFTEASRLLAPVTTERIPRHRLLAAQEIACPNCGAPLQRDVEMCERCGYHTRLRRVVRDFRPEKEHVAGFEWWLKKHLHEHATVGGLKIVFFVFAPIAALAATVILLAVAGIFGFCLLVPLGFLGMVLIAACLIPGPRGADPFNPWWATMQVQRLTGWKLMHEIKRPLNVVERHGREYDDVALDQDPELENAETLDLQGTAVTDEGILLLRFYKNLKFLVVRDTQVTSLGVQNLQFYFPELLIWR